MQPVRSANNIHFHTLAKDQWIKNSKALAASVDFVVADPPFNIRHGKEDGNPNQKSFVFAEIKAMSKLAVRC